MKEKLEHVVGRRHAYDVVHESGLFYDDYKVVNADTDKSERIFIKSRAEAVEAAQDIAKKD